MKKIILHICCGPCATAVIKKLQLEGFLVIGFYYNPNIHPNWEYKKRLKEARSLAEKAGIDLLIGYYQPEDYFKYISGLEENKEKRCQKCWQLRLEKTAQLAKKKRIKFFGSTLRISPYQNQAGLKKVAIKLAKKYKLNFYETDLVGCFSDSIKLSKEEKMYRQNYCGCIFSRDHN